MVNVHDPATIRTLLLSLQGLYTASAKTFAVASKHNLHLHWKQKTQQLRAAAECTNYIESMWTLPSLS